MSTNEEQQLPKTWEAYQQARRGAFAAGWREGECYYKDYGEFASRGRVQATERCLYPIRKKVPRVVKVKSFYARLETNLGSFGNILGIRFYLDPECTSKHIPHWHDAESVAAMADLLANPFEEVEE